jgi:hypothetical protein
MANLQGYELTVTGRALLAKAGTGACTLNFTKVKLGADETSLNDLINKTELVGTNIKQIDIVGSQANEATFTIIATVTNSGMQDNFLIRQVGIFAKGVAATNPGTGVTPENINETLFAVAYDTQPDIIPAESITPYTRQFNANMTVTNVEQCDVTLTPAGVVTVQVLNNHNDNSEAHGNLIKRIFGSANATMESVKTSVQNWCKESIASVFGVASATTDNIKNKVKEWALEKINEWIETLGIRYNIAQNGYICLGKLFGDAIIQWGFCWYAANNGEEAIKVTLPVSFNQKAFISQLTNYDYTILGETHGLAISSDVRNNDLNTFGFYDLAPKGNNNSNGIFYFIIGK